jgi:hypothetical protein
MAIDNPNLSGLGKTYTGKFEEQGTAASGFASDGPYHCEDCIHRSDQACYHPAVMKDKDLPDMPDGTPAKQREQKDGGILVDAERECCRYVHPPE